MKFLGISIDLLYASLQQPIIREDLDINTNATLRHIDPASVRSLNGCRVTDTILLEIEVRPPQFPSTALLALFMPYFTKFLMLFVASCMPFWREYQSLLHCLQGLTLWIVQPTQVPHFRTALRAIKLWAEKRGIYSNVLGYLGGVNWAILVAYICKLFPKAVASTIVAKFFQVLFSPTLCKVAHLAWKHCLCLAFQAFLYQLVRIPK